MEDAGRGERGHGRMDRPLRGVDGPRRRDHPCGREGRIGIIGRSTRRTRAVALFLFSRSFASGTSATATTTLDAQPLLPFSASTSSAYAVARTPARAHQTPSSGVSPSSSSRQHLARLPRSLLRSTDERSALPFRRPSRGSSSPIRPSSSAARPPISTARSAVPATPSLSPRS